MWKIASLAVLSAFGLAAAAVAQPYYQAPRGPYERHCSDIRMNGQFLSAYCRGARGAGRSSINILSCSTAIDVDPSGALVCIGPGGGAPPSVRVAPPGYSTGREYDRRGYRAWRSGHAVALYSRPGWRGRSIIIQGATPNLADIGLNDRVRSIRLNPRSRPWLACTDAEYRGRCVTIYGSVTDTAMLGMGRSISSLRPAG